MGDDKKKRPFRWDAGNGCGSFPAIPSIAKQDEPNPADVNPDIYDLRSCHSWDQIIAKTADLAIRTEDAERYRKYLINPDGRIRFCDQESILQSKIIKIRELSDGGCALRLLIYPDDRERAKDGIIDLMAELGLECGLYPAENALNKNEAKLERLYQIRGCTEYLTAAEKVMLFLLVSDDFETLTDVANNEQTKKSRSTVKTQIRSISKKLLIAGGRDGLRKVWESIS